MRGMIAVACIALAGCYWTKRTDTLYGLAPASQPSGILYVIDVSGSMEGKDEGSVNAQVVGAAVGEGATRVGDLIGGRVGGMVAGRMQAEATKLGGARRQLIPAIRGLPDDTRFDIIVFGGQVATWKPDLVAADKATRRGAIAYVEQLHAAGGTNARAALESAFSVDGVGTVYFLSDGRPTDASGDQILADVSAWNSGGRVVVHTIGLGEDQDDALLGPLAQNNGGSYAVR